MFTNYRNTNCKRRWNLRNEIDQADVRLFSLQAWSRGSSLPFINEFPITGAPAKISKTTDDDKTVERENLLNESLAEHRAGLIRQSKALVEKISSSKSTLVITPEEREVLLQIVNDVRIGSWHALGEPNDLEILGEPNDLEMEAVNPVEEMFCKLMHLGGYFQYQLLGLK
jgi:hypothetical protein